MTSMEKDFGYVYKGDGLIGDPGSEGIDGGSVLSWPKFP